MRTAAARAGALLALVLAACPSPGRPAPAPSPSVVPQRGGTLTLAIAGDLDALDPHIAASPPSWTVARALHRGLFAYPDLPGRAGARPIADLAEAVPRTAEGLSATIVLRRGVRFSDGTPLTAADAVASIHRLTTSPRGIGPALDDELTDAVEEDDLAVRVTARTDLAKLVDLLAHPQAAILDADVRPVGKVRAPRGAGPYVLARERDDAYVLRRRTDAPSDTVRPAFADEIRIEIGGRARPHGLVLDPGPPDLARPGARPRGRVAEVAPLCVRYLSTATAGPIRPRIERALRGLRDIGTGRLASGFLPPLLQEERRPPRRPERTGRDGVRFTLVTSTSPRDLAEAAEIRRLLPGARLVRVPAVTFYGGARLPAGTSIRTSCADLPRAESLLSGVSDGALALWWPVERVQLGAQIRGFTGSPMFPRGDPTALWLAPA